jgi:hypothetical protein
MNNLTAFGATSGCNIWLRALRILSLCRDAPRRNGFATRQIGADRFGRRQSAWGPSVVAALLIFRNE